VVALIGLGTLGLWLTGSVAPAILGTLLLIGLIALEGVITKAAGA